jgi:hypothetical protein
MSNNRGVERRSGQLDGKPVRWRVFHNANVPQEEIEAASDKALVAVRAERFSKRA